MHSRGISLRVRLEAEKKQLEQQLQALIVYFDNFLRLDDTKKNEAKTRKELLNNIGLVSRFIEKHKSIALNKIANGMPLFDCLLQLNHLPQEVVGHEIIDLLNKIITKYYPQILNPPLKKKPGQVIEKVSLAEVNSCLTNFNQELEKKSNDKAKLKFISTELPNVIDCMQRLDVSSKVAQEGVYLASFTMTKTINSLRALTEKYPAIQPQNEQFYRETLTLIHKIQHDDQKASDSDFAREAKKANKAWASLMTSEERKAQDEAKKHAKQKQESDKDSEKRAKPKPKNEQKRRAQATAPAKPAVKTLSGAASENQSKPVTHIQEDDDISGAGFTAVTSKRRDKKNKNRKAHTALIPIAKPEPAPQPAEEPTHTQVAVAPAVTPAGTSQAIPTPAHPAPAAGPEPTPQPAGEPTHTQVTETLAVTPVALPQAKPTSAYPMPIAGPVPPEHTQVAAARAPKPTRELTPTETRNRQLTSEQSDKTAKHIFTSKIVRAGKPADQALIKSQSLRSESWCEHVAVGAGSVPQQQLHAHPLIPVQTRMGAGAGYTPSCPYPYPASYPATPQVQAIPQHASRVEGSIPYAAAAPCFRPQIYTYALQYPAVAAGFSPGVTATPQVQLSLPPVVYVEGRAYFPAGAIYTESIAMGAGAANPHIPQYPLMAAGFSPGVTATHQAQHMPAAPPVQHISRPTPQAAHIQSHAPHAGRWAQHVAGAGAGYTRAHNPYAAYQQTGRQR